MLTPSAMSTYMTRVREEDPSGSPGQDDLQRQLQPGTQAIGLALLSHPGGSSFLYSISLL